MNNATREEAVRIIESRIAARCELDKPLIVKAQIEGELTMAIDMAHLCGAIDLEQQRHFKERLNKIIEREHQQWQESNRRIG